MMYYENIILYKPSAELVVCHWSECYGPGRWKL